MGIDLSFSTLYIDFFFFFSVSDFVGMVVLLLRNQKVAFSLSSHNVCTMFPLEGRFGRKWWH